MSDSFRLCRKDDVLYLEAPHLGAPISVDFLTGKVGHRRRFGGGSGQLIAKAVGVKKLELPTIVDVTAGLGQDAFILACLGCHVTMVERSETIAALLEDGLRRLFSNLDSGALKLSLVKLSAQAYLGQLKERPDVIYMDPMYPDTGNTALNKKEMRILREVVGEDLDAEDVFQLALRKAKKRVVVKRPRKGGRLVSREPDVEFLGKSSRFDLYLI